MLTLAMMAMGRWDRLAMKEFVLSAVRPECLSADCPPGVVADWYEDQGRSDVAAMLRETYGEG